MGEEIRDTIKYLRAKNSPSIEIHMELAMQLLISMSYPKKTTTTKKKQTKNKTK